MSRRPLQPFGRQHPGPPAPFKACRPPSTVLWPSAGHLQPYFGHLPGAFRHVFYRVQEATLGSSLALNMSRRPRSSCAFCSLPAAQRRTLAIYQAPSAVLWHLPGAFREVFYWVQEATVGTKRVPAPFAGSIPVLLRLLQLAGRQRRICRAPSTVLWPSAGRLQRSFLLGSESNVRQ